MGSSTINASSLGLTGTSFGLGQGINVQSVVQALTTAAQAGESVYTNEQNLYNSQISDLQSVSSLLSNLELATQTLQDPAGPLAARTTSSSNPGVLTATASSGISTGSYSVTVNSLASTSTYISLAQKDGTTSIGTGSIQYEINGKQYEIDVNAANNDTTLNSLASYINNNAASFGVTAAVINGANGATLTLTSQTSGTAGEITNMTDNLGLGLGLQNSAISSVQSSSTATVGDGSINYTIGGTNYEIDVNGDNGNETLDTLASYINTNSADLGGVSANVVTDTQGSYLTLTSSSGAITKLSDSTGLNMSSYNSEAVAGQDASLTVNGVTVPQSSNTVTGVIPGLTFSLLGASTSPVTITVSQDVTQATTAINNFVSAYNAVANAMNTEFTYTAGSSSQPPLFSDSSLEQVQSTLATDINYFIQGNNGINGLASLGINLQQDGTLSVDSATLTAALTNNAAAVQNFFQGADYVSGFGGQLYNDVNKLNDPTNGPLALDLQGIDQELQDVTKTISDFNANLLVQQQQWTAEYSQVSATLEQLPSLLQQAGSQVASTSSSTSSSSSG